MGCLEPSLGSGIYGGEPSFAAAFTFYFAAAVFADFLHADLVDFSLQTCWSSLLHTSCKCRLLLLVFTFADSSCWLWQSLLDRTKHGQKY
jgi:hypothetical protein